MQALLGTSALGPTVSERSADVESRLAEVIASVGLMPSNPVPPVRPQRMVPPVSPPYAALTREAAAARFDRLEVSRPLVEVPPRPARFAAIADALPTLRARLLRWLRLAVPLVL